MKLTMAKADLIAAQKVVAPCRAGTGSDLSTHYLFKVISDPTGKAKSRVEIAAYSGQTFASSPIHATEVEGDDADAFTIEGWRLEKWLGALPDDGKPLSFTFTPATSKTVEARAGRGAQQFDSLDPSGFPSWDKVLANAQVTAKMPARLLYSILRYAKDFVGANETKHPEQTVIECRDGVVYAMDGMHAVQIKCSLLKGSTFRIHGKDVKGLISYLGNLKDDEVDLLEDQPPANAKDAEPTTLILRRHREPNDDTPVSIYGENRFTTAFPVLSAPKPNDHFLWTLSKEEVLLALPFLESGAAQEDVKLRISRPNDDVVRLSMKTPRGPWVPQDIASPSPKVAPDLPANVELPADGFLVNKDSFKSALLSMPGDAPAVGVNKLGKGGYLRFTREEGPRGEVLQEGKLNGVEIPEDQRTTFLTVVAWVK